MANNNHFNLTLDTVKPTATIVLNSDEIQYVKENAALTLTRSETEATFMKLWYDTVAAGDEEKIPTEWSAYDAAPTTNFAADGMYYYHVILLDDVNNESEIASTKAIYFDTQAPVVNVKESYIADPDSGNHVYTNDKTGLKLHVEFSDASISSGIQSVVISGDDIETITHGEGTTSPIDDTFNFKSDVKDGTKKLSIVVTDKAGNASVAGEVSIILDTGLTKPVLALLTTADTETILPDYVNYHDIKVKLTDADTDIVAYRIWEGTEAADESKTEDEVPWITQTAGAVNVTVAKTLSENDGTKYIHAQVKDQAGTIATADVVHTVIDSVKPVVSITSDKSIISNVDGYTTAVLTLNASDATAGVKSWALKCGDTTISTGTAKAEAVTFDLTSTNSMVEGVNTLTLEATDNAENTNSATVSVTLDTTAPTVDALTLNSWYNDAFNVTPTFTDANKLVSMQIWTSTAATDTTVPTGTATTENPKSGTEISSANIGGQTSRTQGTNYIHVKVVDEVGNAGYSHSAYGYDNVAPEGTAEFSKDAYPSTTASLSISVTDATSDIAGMNITGDLDNPTTGDWETYASTRAVTLTTGDGNKKVTVKVKDNAGNVLTISDIKTELDTTFPTGVINLFEKDGTTTKAANSPVAEFVSHISFTNDAAESITDVEYLIYGDFTFDAQSAQGITEDTATWTKFSYDSGVGYQVLSNMFCTTGDGTKTINLKVRDNAGNVSGPVTASFVYDTTLPTAEAKDVDYNRISKVNILRRDSSGEIADKYADEIHFTLHPSENIQAYKVCAYKDQTAAAAGTAADAAIPQSGDTVEGLTPASTNMHSTGRSANTDVACMIKGADFEYALGGVSTTGAYDGAHIVVVYVQDLAGQWSAAADFSTAVKTEA